MSEPNYDEIRARVQERFNKQKELSIHGMVYIVINLLVWGLWLSGLAYEIPVVAGIADAFQWLVPLVVTIGWGVGLAAHALDYYYSVGGGARRRDQVIEREIEREMALRQAYEKPKRDRLTLTEDGELEEITEDDYSPDQKRHR
jgi:hypothetical protein